MASFYWPTAIAGSVGPGAFPLLAPDGSVSAPSYSFSNSTSTGIYSSAANTLDFAANGTKILELSSIGANVTSGQLFTQSGTISAPGLCVGQAGNDGFYLSASHEVTGVTNGVAALTLGSSQQVTLGPSALFGSGTSLYNQAYGTIVSQALNATSGSFTAPNRLDIGANFYSVSGTSKALTTSGISRCVVQSSTTGSTLAFDFQTTSTAQTANNAITGQATKGSITVDGKWTIGTGTATEHVLNTLLGTNGAGVLTTANGPAGTSGNPTGYIQITINGATRYIPFW